MAYRRVRRVDGSGAVSRDVAVWLALVALGLLLWTELTSAAAVGVCVLAVGLAALSPTGAAAAMLSAIPFVYHLLPVGSGNFSPVELAILAGCAGLGVRGALAAAQGRLASLLVDLVAPVPVTVVAVALALSGLVSLAFVADPEHMAESLRELRTVILEPIGALVLVRWSVGRGGLVVLLCALVGSGATVALHGIEQVLTRTGGVVGDEAYRARGPYPHPNNLALYLERVVMITAGLALIVDIRRRYLVPVLALLLVGLALTFSRGALVGVAAGGAVLVTLRRPRRGWLYLGGAVAAALAVFAVAAGGRLLATGTEGAVSTRELIWRSSLRMIADHPWSGVGLDQFLYQYSRRYVDPAGWPERYTSHPHNLLLDVWLRLGVLGMVVFAGLVIVTVLLIRAARLDDGWRGGAAAGAIAALVAGVAHGLVDNGFFLPDLAVMTWSFIAILEQDALVSAVLPRWWPWPHRRREVAAA